MRKQGPNERRKVKTLPIQLKYAALLTMAASFTSLILIFVMAWFIQRNYRLFMGDELGISSQVISLVKKEQQLLEISLFVLFLFSIISTFAAAFFVSRKLIGPMISLQRHLWLFGQGDWSRTFRLREEDEFKELEVLVNQVREAHLKSVQSQNLEMASSS
jgi:methyl-accepting chemotaxis protein